MRRILLSIFLITLMACSTKTPTDRMIAGEIPVINGDTTRLYLFDMEPDEQSRGVRTYHAMTLPDSQLCLWGLSSPTGVLMLYEMTGHAANLRADTVWLLLMRTDGVPSMVRKLR